MKAFLTRQTSLIILTIKISTLRVEEDDRHFYLVKECFDLESLSETFIVDYDE